MNKIYIAILDHFGAFRITAIGNTAEEAKSVAEAKYIERYIQRNGNDPRREEWGWGMTRFEADTRTLFVKEMVIGEAELIER